MQITRIAVRLDPNWNTDRIMLGILRRSRALNWVLSHGDNSVAFVRKWSIRGVLGHMNLPDVRRYQRAGVCMVSLNHNLAPYVPSVAVDHAAVARVAADHLLERGFSHFAYIGDHPQVSRTRHGHGPIRRRSFVERLGSRAKTISICPVDYGTLPGDFDTILAWLRELPKPVGIFANDDMVAACVTEVCHLANIPVPGEVSVIGANDDPIRTVGSRPEITSVKIPWERLGMEAASLLHAQITGQAIARQLVSIAPTGVAVRGSTDISVIADNDVAAAARFIRAHAHHHIDVQQVADATTISRRLLERRFKATLGRTLLEEVHHVRLERACRMLSESDLRVADIARACGLRDGVELHRLFRRAKGMTPANFRRQTTIPRAR